MAITKTLTNDESGATFQNAYANIQYFHGDKITVRYGVSVYFDAQARMDGKHEIANYNFDFPFTVGFTYADLYADLKSRPEFAGAVDC